MSSLRLVGVGFAHAPDAPVLVDVHLHLAPGITAVVGPNGAGKTTLLRLLAGELAPLTGRREGTDDVHLVPQRVDTLDDEVRAFAWGWTGERCWALQSRLALDPADLERWPTLSPGERKRWQIGAALARDPEVLLLDEPTNHLDPSSRGWVLDALAAFRGVGVVVSHDRALLRRLASTVVRVEGGAVHLFPGGWDAACAAWEQAHAAHARRVEEASRAEAAARARLADARREAASAAAAISAGARVKGPRDHDGRSMGARFRAERASGQASRRVTLERRRAAERAEVRDALVIRDPLGGPVRFDAVPSRRPLALRTDALLAGPRSCLSDVDLVVDAGEKVWVRGDNGSGKSTLLNALLAACTLPSDLVLALPQRVDPPRVRDALHALPAAVRGEVLHAVAALGVDPAGLLRSEQLSPGEARKLAVALGLGRRVALLALDEPTNHLDLPSVVRLERALRAYRGSVVLVTHDEELGAAVADTVWTLRQGRVEVG